MTRERKPIPANISPEMRAYIERTRARYDSWDRDDAVMNEKIRKEEKAAGLNTVGQKMLELITSHRPAVREVDETAATVTSEDRLYDEQVAREDEEDHQGRK